MSDRPRNVVDKKLENIHCGHRRTGENLGGGLTPFRPKIFLPNGFEFSIVFF